MSRLFCAAGAGVIDCPPGHVSKAEKLVYGRRFQVPFSDCIRREISISTIAVGNIFEDDQVNIIVAAGHANLCDIARLHVPVTAWKQPSKGIPTRGGPSSISVASCNSSAIVPGRTFHCTHERKALNTSS